MRMCRMILYFLVLLIRESNVQGGFCPKNKPVVKFCANNGLQNLTDVYIDTTSVPLHQESLCECRIFRFDSVQYKFSFYEEPLPENMVFKINHHVLSTKGIQFTWSGDTAKLSLLTTKNYTDEGACLIVSADDNSSFNITCEKSTNSTEESSTSSTSEGSETSTRQATDTEPYRKKEKETGDINVIIPVVASIAGLVVLVVVILVIVFCRRRSAKKEEQTTTSNEVVEKEDDDDYYMTENPMYNATEPQPKVQHFENEYHYIEPDNHDGRRSVNHYESLPDSPLRKQSTVPPAKETDQGQHYAYSTCLSNSQKCQPVVGNEGKITSKSDSGSVPNKRPGVDENTYDSTDKTAAKHFIGVNEYHHLTPSGSRKKVAIDTYNTVGNVGDNKQEDDAEESEYHVASLR